MPFQTQSWSEKKTKPKNKTISIYIETTQVKGGKSAFVNFFCYTLRPKSSCEIRKGIAPTCLESLSNFLYIFCI